MENLDSKTFSYLLYITINDLRDWAHYSQLLQCISKYFKTGVTLLSDSPYAWATSFWILILKLKTLGYLWFIASYYLGVVDNYNKEKVIATNRITPTTRITKTIKISLLKLFLYFKDN